MKDLPNLKLQGDYHKPTKTHWDKQQKEDWLFMVLPSLVILCLVAAALIVGFYKLLEQ